MFGSAVHCTGAYGSCESGQRTWEHPSRRADGQRCQHGGRTCAISVSLQREAQKMRDYSVVPQYPQGIDSSTPMDAEICRCSNSLFGPHPKVLHLQRLPIAAFVLRLVEKGLTILRESSEMASGLHLYSRWSLLRRHVLRERAGDQEEPDKRQNRVLFKSWCQIFRFEYSLHLPEVRSLCYGPNC